MKSEDHVAILTLYARYNRAIDDGDAEGWSATFVEDGVFCHPARTWAGAAERRQFVIERNAKIAAGPVGNQRHWNDAIDLTITADAAAGGCDLLVAGVASDDGRAVVLARGRYQDRLARTADGWRFAERRLILI